MELLIISALCSISGGVISLKRKHDSQREYAEKSNNVWPGWQWWLGKNAWPIFWHYFGIVVGYLVFHPLLTLKVLKNPDASIAFGLNFAGADLSFELAMYTVFTIAIYVGSFLMGMGGMELLLAIFAKAKNSVTNVLKRAIDEKTSSDPAEVTTLPDPNLQPTNP